jgi:hypothetical protein
VKAEGDAKTSCMIGVRGMQKIISVWCQGGVGERLSRSDGA